MTMRWNRLSASASATVAVLVVASAALSQTPTSTATKPRVTATATKPAAPATKPAAPAASTAKSKIPMPPPPAVPGSDIVHFSSRIGSFKLLGSDQTPVAGTLEMKFDGTVLVSGLVKGSVVQTTGTLRMEKETPDHLKQVYFGNGEMTIKGTMRALQIFAKDITGTFKGMGIFRLFGEFDNHLETGFIWYDGEEKRPWATGGNQFVVPNPAATSNSVRVRVHSAG